MGKIEKERGRGREGGRERGRGRGGRGRGGRNSSPLRHPASGINFRNLLQLPPEVRAVSQEPSVPED